MICPDFGVMKIGMKQFIVSNARRNFPDVLMILTGNYKIDNILWYIILAIIVIGTFIMDYLVLDDLIPN